MINVEKNNFLPTMVRCIEFLRIAFISLGFFMIYQVPSEQRLFWFIALVVIPLTGSTAFESLLLSTESAKFKSRESGCAYQIQSGLHNLSIALVGIASLAMHFNKQALLTIALISMIFFFFSSLFHLYEFLILKKPSIHLWRFILTICLLLACLPIALHTFH